MAAQLGEVEPVRHRPHPVPGPLGAGGVEHHFPRARRDIDRVAGRIGEGDPVEGAVGVVTLPHRPLVLVDRSDRRRVGQAREAARDRQGLGLGDVVDAAPVQGRNRDPPQILQPVHRLPVHHLQLEAPRKARRPGGGQCLARVDMDLVPGDRLGAHHPFARGERGKRHVHHHQARDEPHGEQDAGADADPAVDEVEPASAETYQALRRARRMRRDGIGFYGCFHDALPLAAPAALAGGQALIRVPPGPPSSGRCRGAEMILPARVGAG